MNLMSHTLYVLFFQMNDLILEMIDVKNELADARAQLSMSVVVVDKQPPALLQCQMCKSLDRGAVDESKSIISNLQNQVQGSLGLLLVPLNTDSSGLKLLLSLFLCND